ncbi:bifunctional lysine-specific demethylase and histidyl-hydroxylase NO66 [Scaptodrosophila lebanonensis]|uniref:Bifunctional lysine-specific demethylase and histidyl-hydroxylase n=1 Tax=Drosophila lebanonensis TaxID=7225 RepID=A0A6J2TZE9_DROLE|nr:bifunctional lysine-specific demethylase and histidyl-hydroxylase NO66 [Scaptodrosophila lebanonensis]
MSAFAAYNKPKANGRIKSNGSGSGAVKKGATARPKTALQNGVRSKNSKGSRKAAPQENESFNPTNMDKLIDELYKDGKPLSKSQNQKKQKLEAYLAEQLGPVDNDGSSCTASSEEDTGSCNDDGSSNEDSSDGDESHTNDSDDSDEEQDSAQSSDDGDSDDDDDDSDDDEDDSNDDDDDDDDDDSSGETDSDAFSEEYTMNSYNTSGESSQSSPAVVNPKPVRQKAAPKSTAQKRQSTAAGGNNDDDLNNNKPAKQMKRNSLPAQEPKPSVNGTSERRKTIALGTEKSCPLLRNPKSCPLPPKVSKSQSAPRSCPIPVKRNSATTSESTKKTTAPTSSHANKNAGAKSLTNRKKVAPEKANSAQIAAFNERPEVHKQNSIEEGKRMFFWVVNPLLPEAFFAKYWEQNACHVKRKDVKYFSKLISFKLIDEMLIRHHLEFTTNIDVTSYTNGVRQTHNPEGRAMPPAVWGYYGEGCSVRILNPSTYLSGLRELCSKMQEYFHCLVGANVYLTPPNSQGFAPHYDDIEAFVLQVEGRKRWRLYSPIKNSDVLARTSSGNFEQSQLGAPIYDEILEPGDVLYFPRGTVHQAVTEDNNYSLHITLSVYQKQAYADLLENLMPIVLQRSIKHHVNMRRGLPLHTWKHLGLANGDVQTRERTELVANVQHLVSKYLMPSPAQIDAAVDQLAKRFQHEALPPTVLPEELKRTVFGSRNTTDSHGKCLCDYELTDSHNVRLLRANILRLVADEGALRVYYYVENAVEFCKYDANFMEIEPTEAAAIEMLMRAYPGYISIGQLPMRSSERRVEVATALWERGLLMTEKPFK